MSIKALPGFSAALAFLGAPALADLSAAELWRIWQGDGAVAVSAARVQDGADGLTLHGVRIGSRVDDSVGTFLMDRIALTDTTDDQVSITIPAPLRFEGSSLPQGASFVVDLSSSDIVADRDGGRVSYGVTASEIAATLTGDTGSLPDLSYALRDVAMQIDAGTSLSQPVMIDTRAASVLGNASIPDDGTSMDFAARDLQGDSRIETASGLFRVFAAQIQGDMRATSSFTDLDLTINTNAPRGPVAAGVKVDAVQVKSSTIDDALSTRIDTTVIALDLRAPGFPNVTPTATLDALLYDLKLPLKAGIEGPLDLRIDMKGLAPADRIWSLIDPQALLSRDPADVNVDLTARVIPPRSLLALPPSDGPETAPPLDVLSVSLNALGVSALGATITGQGQVDAPLDPENADGRVTLTATGFLELLDTLSGLGLLPPGQELGARMGLAIATVPDPDGDGLKSEIVFGPDGAIHVNDRQVR